MPANGDLNPYGIAVVPGTAGRLTKGDVLVSNFNAKSNVQGTGTTIVELSPSGARTTFADLTSLRAKRSCPGGIGLTTALVALPGGWVVVGSLPSGPGGSLPAANPAGCLIVLNSAGTPVETWSSPNINGPWDMTAAKTASGVALFLSNVLSRPAGTKGTPPSGQCTVVRIDVALAGASAPQMTGSTVIGSGYVWQANKAALVQGPTGVALGRNGTLYVAETLTDKVSAIPEALTRTTAVDVSSSTLSSEGSLRGPLGMTLAPDGDVVAVNGNNGDAVEITPAGRQVATVTLAHNGAGDLFGLTVAPGGKELLFVNDGTNALDVASVR